MGKNFNPVDAHRKAQRAKELKKNKDTRKDKRESTLVKKDTRELENEIKTLKAEGKLNEPLKARLAELEKELKYVNTLKEKYVKEHPEAKDQVFKPREGGGGRRSGPGYNGEKGEDREDGVIAGPSTSIRDGDPMGHLYDPKTGIKRDPKRSIYYDPTYNPFGAPPPGMPYREKSVESDDEDDSDDDDIVMPEGPRPGVEDSDDDSDDSDDIPLPAGPPPPRLPPVNSVPVGYSGFSEPMQARPHPMQPQHQFRPPQTNFRPPPGNFPPRPPAAPHALPPRPLTGPSPNGSVASVISAQPSISRPTTEMPASSSASTPVSETATAATISAEPQMRDLRKEATIFVPRGIKRKKVGATTINATPGGGDVDEDGDSVRVRRDDGPGLLGKLKSVLGDAPKGGVTSNAPISKRSSAAAGGDDDYKNFLAGLDDLS